MDNFSLSSRERSLGTANGKSFQNADDNAHSHLYIQRPK